MVLEVLLYSQLALLFWASGKAACHSGGKGSAYLKAARKKNRKERERWGPNIPFKGMTSIS
jgi:hypothetical protein